MSEKNTGGRTTCQVCGAPLKDNWLGWRHTLFCSLECKQLAARWQLNQISVAAGHQSGARPVGAGGGSAPQGKGQPGHAGESATDKTPSS